ncbi:hypothetical protein EJB05_04562, partial [Eragrostis curvula]
MAKRRSDERDGERTPKRRQQHLYLVFDDWSQGYSIRKLDLCDTNPSSDSGYDDDEASETPHAVAGVAADPRLPSTVFRMPAERGLPQYFASAFGTMILAMQPGERAAGLFPVFDVRARGSIWGPQLHPDPPNPVYFTVGGDRLFALAAGSFQYQLYPPPLEHAGGQNCVWQWYQLPKPPFKRKHVVSHALHPDGRTIFVSTERRGAAATFAFDTEAAAAGFEWKRHGEWALPFDGPAHFDAALDAFVGLSKDPDALGHLCSCDAAPAPAATSSDGGDDDGQRAVRARKLSKEKFFSEDPAETHVGARLLHIGRSKFCLVQCVSTEDGRVDDEDQLEEEEEDVPRPRRHLFRLTTFSLKYDKNGDVTTGTSRRVQYCRVPKASTESLLKNPLAFWM